MKHGPLIGYMLGFFIVVPSVLLSVFSRESQASLTVLIAVAGGLIGWIVGMLLAPVSPDEADKFPEYGKAVSTFAAGYLAGKVDKLFDLYFKDTSVLNELFLKELSVFVIMFLFGALTTYVWRHYLHSKTPSDAQAVKADLERLDALRKYLVFNKRPAVPARNLIAAIDDYAEKLTGGQRSLNASG